MRSAIILFVASASMFGQIAGPHRKIFASAPAPTTVTYVTSCEGPEVPAPQCLFATGQAPVAGQALVFTLWANVVTTVSSICDDVAHDCSGDHSAYTLANGSSYVNGTAFQTFTYYTCNYRGPTIGTPDIYIQITLAGGSGGYVSGVALTGNTSTGTDCNDGYAHNQDATGVAYTTSPNTATTTNAHDLLLGVLSNECGVSSFTAGDDGSAHSYTLRVDSGLSHVTAIETLEETAIGSYIATATAGSACRWNMEVLAIK